MTGRQEKKDDFYPTPQYATSDLLNKEDFIGSCWEPACGKGDISKILIGRGLETISSDLNDYGYGITGRDFLNPFFEEQSAVENIITNPPFRYALEFVEQSKKLANKKIAMFLKTTFLEGIKRKEMFLDKEFPIKCMYQFSKRVSFGKEEGTHDGGGMMAFAWFVWDRDYKGRPFIDWI